MLLKFRQTIIQNKFHPKVLPLPVTHLQSANTTSRPSFNLKWRSQRQTMRQLTACLCVSVRQILHRVFHLIFHFSDSDDTVRSLLCELNQFYASIWQHFHSWRTPKDSSDFSLYPCLVHSYATRKGWLSALFQECVCVRAPRKNRRRRWPSGGVLRACCICLAWLQQQQQHPKPRKLESWCCLLFTLFPSTSSHPGVFPVFLAGFPTRSAGGAWNIDRKNQ